MENKKSNVGWIILTIVLLLIIGGLSFIILKDKGIIKIGNSTKENTKTETKAEEKNKKESKSERELQLIKGLDDYKDGENKLGKITFYGKEYEVKVVPKVEYDEKTYDLYIGDKKIENVIVKYVAVMDDSYIVVRSVNPVSETVQNLTIYDKDFNESPVSSVSITSKFKVINNDGTISDTTPTANGKIDTTKEVIDSNHLIIAECTPARNSANYNQDYVEKLYSFENGKVEIEELTVVENIFCSAQR